MTFVDPSGLCHVEMRLATLGGGSMPMLICWLPIITLLSIFGAGPNMVTGVATRPARAVLRRVARQAVAPAASVEDH